MNVLLIIHIAAGTVALLSGGFAAASRKGGRLHRKSGKIFAASMVLCALSAIGLSILNPNAFLLGIGLFTLYLVCSGWIWVLRIQNTVRHMAARILGGFGLAVALFLLYRGVLADPGLNVISLVFGGVLIVFALHDLLKHPTPDRYMRLHGGRMGGAYIAAVTAFVVVNASSWLPPLVVWLGPTVVGTPLITVGIRNFYRKRSSSKKKA